MSTTKNRPIERIQIGTVRLSIWRNEGEDRPFYSTSVENSYRDSEQWRTSSSYGLRDLLNLAKASLIAHSAIARLEHMDRSVTTVDGQSSDIAA